jgi:2-polyprenyl-3-methyl-5-hydroxy-6-metoxy-1,4-benzoquinol methylase
LTEFDRAATFGREMASHTQAERWKSEAEFFDRFAAGAASEALSPLDPSTRQRYVAHRLRRRFNKEFRFRLLPDLRGKRVLDLGCGDGVNSVLLAQRGGTVMAVDISQKSIQVARHRAQANGVEAQTTFICSPIELLDIPPGSIDVVWGDGILHHLIPELEMVLQKLVHWSKEGACIVFSEPVCLNRTLRRLRGKVPIHTDATPDERQLEEAELNVVRRYLPNLKERYFQFLGRLDRLLLEQNNYERTPIHRKLISNLLRWIDYLVLSMPGIRRLGGSVVMHAKVQKPAA